MLIFLMLNILSVLFAFLWMRLWVRTTTEKMAVAIVNLHKDERRTYLGLLIAGQVYRQAMFIMVAYIEDWLAIWVALFWSCLVITQEFLVEKGDE